MSRTHAALGALALALMVALPGDAAPVTGGGRPHPTPARANGTGVLPAFASFGWVSPPADSTTETRIAEVAATGFDLMLPALEDTGSVTDNLVRCDLAAANGMRCLVWDHRFERFQTLDPHSAAGGAWLDTIGATYRTHPGFAGYYLGDEPPVARFSLLRELHAALRERDPDHPAWNDLLGSYSGGWQEWPAYVRSYLDSTHASVLCYNEYDFQISGDKGLFVRQLAAASAIAHEYGIPFWVIVQVIQHYDYRALTDGELRWQSSMALAYGARGTGYFTYWTPTADPAINWQYGLIDASGAPTHWYDLISGFNPRVVAAGRVLARFTRLWTAHAGSVPPGAAAFESQAWISGVEGRAALGAFADSAGGCYLLIANSDSLASRDISLTLPGALEVAQLSGDGSQWLPLALVQTRVSPDGEVGAPRVTLTLAAGDFALVRVAGAGEPRPSGSGPALRADPNPGHGSVRFELARVQGSGRLEMLDASGARIWSHDLAAGSSSVVWNGTRSSGGHAAPGVYFARARDAGGVTVIRVSWLGH
ncbi:MAG: FlgD immunoglobulin-like domain containing protein [Candidatus Eiseniibacteriota bacterium]